ncbi:DUF2612 domain-containing protein [bacterium]|nr:DUF2612 domain-containing protein [bacterium]
MTVANTEYLKLITSQYQGAPKFLEWLTAPLTILNDISECADLIPSYFDLDTAVGVQLDALGLILGQTRVLPFEPTDGSSSTLDDATYRKILRLKAFTNYWDGSTASIYKAWYIIFPNSDLTITDNQDMSATISITGNLSQIVIDMINNDLVIPRPEGVQYNFGGGTLAPIPIFAFDLNNEYFKGLDEGYWDNTLI